MEGTPVQAHLPVEALRVLVDSGAVGGDVNGDTTASR